MTKRILFVCALALAFSAQNRAFAHPFLDSVDGDVTPGGPTGPGPGQQGSTTQTKVLAKLIKHSVFRLKVMEVLKGRVSTCVEQFSENYKGQLQSMVQKLRDKAQEQGLTVGEYVPANQQEVEHETQVEQRQNKFIEKLQTMRGVVLEGAFLRWVIKDSDRLTKLHDQIAAELHDRLGDGLRAAIQENKATLQEAKQSAQNMLGEQR